MVACLAGFAAGMVLPSVLVMLFYQAVKLVEITAVRRQQEGGQAILSILPQTASLLEENEFGKSVRTIKPVHIKEGDLLTVQPGEIIPIDGVVEEGLSTLAATGKPYDTLHHAIGITGEEFGSLRFYGIGYRQVELLPDGQPDLPGIREALEDPAIKAVTLQRSIGYSTRKALSIEQIQSVCSAVKEKRKDVSIFVE